MIEIRIASLVWDDYNEQHIWEKHQLTRAQVEGVCYGDATQIQVNTTYAERYLIVGPGIDGKLYAVVLGPEGENTFYPVSARRASTKERRRYAEWREGKNERGN
jgi:uncharacterized DUF497 family protein